MAYMTICETSGLVGKKAKIIPCSGYSRTLFGMSGTIKCIYQLAFLEFDKQSLKKNKSNLKRGVYLSEDCFELTG